MALALLVGPLAGPLGLVGCLREPVFQGAPSDAGPDADADAGPGGPEPEVFAAPGGVAGPTITGPNFELVFASGLGRFPESVAIGGTEMLGDAAVCNFERGLGLGLYPTLLVNDAGPASSGATVTSGLAGPLVAQIRVQFSTVVACAATSTTISGATTFTAFPDGRINRHDNLDLSSMLTSTGCPVCTGGTSDDNFVLTSFTTLRADPGDAVHPVDVEALAEGDQTSSSERAVCSAYEGRQIALGWSRPDQGRRIRSVAPLGGTPRTLAFVHDFTGVTQDLQQGTRDLATTMLLAQGASCVDLHARANTLTTGEVRIELAPFGGAPELMGPGLDGIYGADIGPADRPVGPVAFRPYGPRLDGGYALWLELGAQQPLSAITIRHSVPAKATSGWVRTQVVNASQIVFYFRDPLLAGEVITITPPPPS